MRNSRLIQALFVVLPVVAAVAATSILIALVGSDPGEVFTVLMQGAFRNPTAIGNVISFWIPMVMVSMGLIVTFTAGLWNIGVEGQMMIGAICASWAARTLALPPVVLVPVELLLAAAGGAAWALIIGVLKTRFGVNEIFGGVGFNALANVIAIWLIAGPWAPPEGGNAQATAPFPDQALLQPISTEFPVSLLALVIALITIVGITLLLRGTRWGLQLKATGKNSRSALLMGVPTTRSAITALMLCGLVAGVAGSFRVLFTYDSLRPFVSGGIGFTGLLVVLLVGVRALWTPFVAFLFAVILAGSTRLRVALQLDQSLAGVLQGVLVLLVLLSNGLRQRVNEWLGRRETEAVAAKDTAGSEVSHE